MVMKKEVPNFENLWGTVSEELQAKIKKLEEYFNQKTEESQPNWEKKLSKPKQSWETITKEEEYKEVRKG